MHVIPHSHTDLGWLATLEDYFGGGHPAFYLGNIYGMFSTVIEELSLDPKRTFTYAEMKYFKMWWERQNVDI